VTELPQLLDARGLMREMGITKAAASTLMQKLPIVTIDDFRKVYVRRSDVIAYLDARTFATDQVQRDGL
jgi:hypothetical protein